MTTLSSKWYSLKVASGASTDKPGLFEWRIEGVGSYIGTFKTCESRLKDFKRNVQRLLNGEDYRPKDPHGFRRIHHELAKAFRAGVPIQVIVLENPGAEIGRRKRELIAERGNLNDGTSVAVLAIGVAPVVAPDSTTRPASLKSPGLRQTEESSLSDEESGYTAAEVEAGYLPLSGDRRQIVDRQIRERRGQQRFRDDLRQRYGEQCMVTGCKVLAVLEASHVRPYRGKDDNHPQNGLLLRSDIHTLFDLDLLGIEPDSLQVEVHRDLAQREEYAHLAGKRLKIHRGVRPSLEALKLRYEQFQSRGDE